MKPNRFLSNALRGRQDPLMAIVAIMLTWIAFLILGGMVMLVPVGFLMVTNPSQAEAYLADPMNFKLLEMDMIVVFALIMCQFIVGLGGIWIGERFLLRKMRFSMVATGYPRFRFKRMLAGLGVWMGLMVIYQLIGIAFNPGSVKMTTDVGRFLVFLPVAMALVPLQCAFEEIAIRGQLMQILSRLTPQMPILPLVVTSIVFATLHLTNKEVTEYGIGLMMAHYFTFALVLGAFALIDEGLELSIGIHIGNNLFSLCLVSYPGSSLETPALLEQQVMTATLDFVVLLAFVVLMYFIFFGKRQGALKALFENVSTGPAVPGEEFNQTSPEEGNPF